MRIFVFLYWGEEKGWWLALRSTFFGPVYLSVLDPTLIPKRKCIIRRFFFSHQFSQEKYGARKNFPDRSVESK